MNIAMYVMNTHKVNNKNTNTNSVAMLRLVVQAFK